MTFFAELNNYATIGSVVGIAIVLGKDLSLQAGQFLGEYLVRYISAQTLSTGMQQLELAVNEPWHRGGMVSSMTLTIKVIVDRFFFVIADVIYKPPGNLLKSMRDLAVYSTGTAVTGLGVYYAATLPVDVGFIHYAGVTPSAAAVFVVVPLVAHLGIKTILKALEAVNCLDTKIFGESKY